MFEKQMPFISGVMEPGLGGLSPCGFLGSKDDEIIGCTPLTSLFCLNLTAVLPITGREMNLAKLSFLEYKAFHKRLALIL